jgi:small-conductance mechanosensitive channel
LVRRQTRQHTLLPIFRNVLFALVIAVAAMMALAELGVEIGPLIVGASVVGFAIAQRPLELIHPVAV